MSAAPPTAAVETCGQCGFGASEWDDRDTANTVMAAPSLVDGWTEGMAISAVHVRPEAGTWSVAEYVDHIGSTLRRLRTGISTIAAEPGIDLGPAVRPDPPGEHRHPDLDVATETLAAEATALWEALVELTDDQWTHSGTVGGVAHSVRWLSRHAVHDTWHHLTDIADVRTALGDGVPAQTGTVAQVSSSGGGVPKRPLPAAAVGRRGVEGDVQRTRFHHGRPWQALCLWSTEVIDALAAEGHPVFAGAAGENLTLAGLDWGTLRAGAVLSVGDTLRCRLSAPAVPCAKNRRWFADRDSSRIDHALHPGSSRWYAAVLTPGRVEPGATVTVRAPAEASAQGRSIATSAVGSRRPSRM